MSTDINNTDPQYWEKVLALHTLDEKKLGLLEEPVSDKSEDDGQLKLKRGSAKKMSHIHQDFDALRANFDGSDPFMAGGHQILKIRTREKEIPDWATDNSKVQALIESVFPDWRVNPRQRAGAGRWAAVIYLHYRMEMSRSAIAEELGIRKASTVKYLLRRVKRVVQGLRSDNKQARRMPPSIPLVEAVRETS